MKSSAGLPAIVVTGDGAGVVSHAGARLLVETARRSGVAAGLSQRLSLWRAPRAVHDPGKIVLDLAVAIAAGGDCAADIAMLRAQPEVFGPVASDPTVSRLISLLAEDPEGAGLAIRAARAQARQRVWGHAGIPWQADGHGRKLVIDLDATYIDAHSPKEQATKARKGFGFHPLLGFVDHGEQGTGEAMTGLLRPGNAGAGTAADHITLLKEMLAHLPEDATAFDEHCRRPILVRTDSAGATHAFTRFLIEQGIEFSLGAKLGDYDIDTILAAIPPEAWIPAINPDGTPQPDARVCEATALFGLTTWPQNMRVILKKDEPLPGSQLTITDHDGMRVTGLFTSTGHLTPPELELRHRRHARVEDRIRCGKDTGLANLPFHGFAHNQIWLEICALAQDLLALTQRAALTGPARRWEPKTLRHRLLATAARLVRTGRQLILRYAQNWPWTPLLTSAFTRLHALSSP
ncbi:IS1380 family transposase [Saccharopolyspora shandongensis]|uniref:IS1380 family transposase n=1 Tax=Saccharopolyspora shandongensis TaxID=418495 RepID=UPI0033C49BD3